MIAAQLIIDPDPVAAARRVLNPKEGPTRISVMEITAMAGFIQQVGAPVIEHIMSIEEPAAEPPTGPGHRVLSAFQTFAKAYRAGFTAPARTAFDDLEHAISALADQLNP
jgi:hypothetical protein